MYANLAKSYNGVAPEFNTEGHINIRKGRHPLLDAKLLYFPMDSRRIVLNNRSLY